MKNKIPYFKKLDNKIKIAPTNSTPNSSEWPESWKRIYFKQYIRFPKIKLDKDTTETTAKKVLYR